MTVIFIKYKLVCSVSISGEKLGYITNKNEFEAKVSEITNIEKTQNVAYIDTVVPEYSLAFITNSEEINEEQILNKIAEQTVVTYKYYAVTIDNEQKSIVNTLDEAENLVSEMKEQYKNTSVIEKIGINEIYTQNENEYKAVDIKVAEEKVSNELEEIESATVNGVYLAQKPISGVITSRYGERESIRSYAHTGLDIAAPYGTKIKSASEGTVTWAGYKGSYGNLIIVNCGNGVEIYYGHCSKLYVKAGDKVKAGDEIGAVGSTGNSTGNHLHFEIRVNGNRVNPQNYIYN